MNGLYHEVIAGDCIESIADQYGFFWETIWALPENWELKRRRKNPNVLLAGDRVFVPEKRVKTEIRSTDQRHRFVRRGVPSFFEIRLLRDDEPRAGVRFTLTVNGRTQEGATDFEGRFRVAIPPSAQTAELRIGEERYALQLGHLDPVAEINGIQQRLRNLGFACPVTGRLDQETQGALAAFQTKTCLPPTGEPDDSTRAKLIEVHAC